MIKDDSIKQTNYAPDKLYSIMWQAEQDGAYVACIRGQFCSTLDDFFKEVSSAMRFPYYFGWNWASFDECITDLEWLKFSSILIVLDNYELFFNAGPSKEEESKLLIKYLFKAIEEWTSQGVPISTYLNYWSGSKK